MAKADANLFKRCIEPHLETLFRTAYRLARNSADAEDLVQDTCLRAVERLGEVDHSRSVRAWLLSMLYNRFIDEARRANRSPVENSGANVEQGIVRIRGHYVSDESVAAV